MNKLLNKLTFNQEALLWFTLQCLFALAAGWYVMDLVLSVAPR